MLTEERLVTYEMLKSKYPNALLMFLTGDVYEMYLEDADDASRICNRSVCSQKFGNERIHICGFTSLDFDSCVTSFIRNGRKVCVIE